MAKESNGKGSNNKKYFVLAGFILLGLIILGDVAVRKILSRLRELKKVDELIAGQKEESRRLLREIDLAQNDKTYLDRLARKELGLIQEGEIEYRFIDFSKNNEQK